MPHLSRSLSDLATSAPQSLGSTLAAAKEGEVGRQELVAALLRECRKEKLEYRVVALEAAGTVLSELGLDQFEELYEIVSPHLPKPVPEADKENGGGKEELMEVDREEGVRQVELQFGILTCLGLAWPETKETQEKFLGPMVSTCCI